jgi:hypothetical protein
MWAAGRVLLVAITLFAGAPIAGSQATSGASGAAGPRAVDDVRTLGGTPSCMSSRLVAQTQSGARTLAGCEPQCVFISGRLVCTCKLKLTISCAVRCTVECSGNRTRSTTGFARTTGDDRARGLRKCLRVAEENARALAWVSYPKCKVTRCRPVLGLAKPEIARRIYFGAAPERPAAV